MLVALLGINSELPETHQYCYDTRMIFDALPYRETLSATVIIDKALRAFADYVEKKLGVYIIKDMRDFYFSRPDLREPLELAALLKENGILKELGPSQLLSDIPHMKAWYAICNDETSHVAGGMTWENEKDALYAALAEGLERYLWYTQDDYFLHPIQTTEEKIRKLGPYISPKDITGFSEEQRKGNPHRELRSDSQYLWIQGTSLIRGNKVYLPAQVISGMRREKWQGSIKEPLIRQQITNGLATWPTQAGARLAGMQEIIEREAFMILWFNQLTLPRIAPESLFTESPSLEKAVVMCEKYRFKTHIIPLLTDAPTHAVAVVMEDMSGNAPRFSVGIRAHVSFPAAVEKAMTEALRSHRAYRQWEQAGNVWDTNTAVEKIGHRDRLYYWGMPEHAKHLEFMVSGPKKAYKPKAWDKDSIEAHLQRLLEWCKEKDFECISVSLGNSAKNLTPFYVEMTVIPQLLPTHLDESLHHFGGTRLYDIPKSFGYTPLKKPFTARPHPFS